MVIPRVRIQSLLVLRYASVPLPPWLNTAWSWVVGLVFVFFVPIWIIVWYERHPALGIAQFVIIAWLVRGWLAQGWTQRSGR